jgi:hypothetical protein
LPFSARMTAIARFIATIFIIILCVCLGIDRPVADCLDSIYKGFVKA